MNDNITIKKCTSCGHWLPVRKYYPHRYEYNGVVYEITRSRCKECMIEAVRKYQKKVAKCYAKKRNDLKLCYLCKLWKRHNQFYADRSRSTGLSSRCKRCDDRRRKDRRETRKQSVRSRP